MFCCCAKNRATSYALEESVKPVQVNTASLETQPSQQEQQQQPQTAAPVITSDTKIITGKGALSTSNPNLAAGEASLDKITISAHKREKSLSSPDYSEPSKVNGVHQSDTADSKVTPATSSPVQDLDKESPAQGKSVSVISVSKEPVVEPPSESIEKPLESSSSASQSSSAPPTESELESFNSALDQVERELVQAESKKSVWEAQACVPDLAAQLKQALLLLNTSGVGMSDKLGAAVSRLEAVASRLEALAAGSGGAAAGGDGDEVAPFVLAYDEVLSGPLAAYISLSDEIGGDVKTQAAIVKDAFDAQRAFLVVASKSKQPDSASLAEILKPTASKIQAAQEFRENNRRSSFFNHLSALSESIAALGWVTVSPAPGPFVKEMADAGTFYTNRVLKEFKEKDPKHVQWTRNWISVLTQLQAYIKQFHTTGVSWNPRGGNAKDAVSGTPAASPPPPPAGGAPPPPPPPGPPPPPAPETSGADDGARNALFAEISRGADVTKGLKKVTDDMKTHKNPALRQGPAPFKASQPAKPVASPKPAPKVADKPPVFELQGKKWVLEYHKGKKDLVLENTELKQTIYIFKCQDCVIQVKGKVNSIILDSCKKTAIVFDSLLASLEFVNCQSMQAQVQGKLPTVSIDKTDGCQVYLSTESLDTEIVTAKSSEMNILIPQADGDFKEFALPEQFKTKYDGKTMVTTMAESI